MNQINIRNRVRLEPDLGPWTQPSRLSGAVFRAKVTAFQARRLLVDMTANLKRLQPGPPPADYVVLAQSRSALWIAGDLDDRAHQRGKVENLRRATRAIGAGLLPAGQLFSFWRQVGRASRGRGYVNGRMLQEGCLVPAIGGGLCQLSNALYDAALRAGCEIVERHAHSRIVPGSAAEHGRDATVAWNYVDLRVRSDRPLHLTAQLTGTELVVTLRGPAGDAPARKAPAQSGNSARPREAESCATCDAVSCFRHEERPGRDTASAPRKVWLVDDNWPEFQAYRAANAGPADIFGLPLDGHRWRQPRYAWAEAPTGRTRSAALETLARAAAIRRAANGPARRRAELNGAKAIARSLGRLLTADDVEVVVAQSLLPWLWREGRLGGRRFSVLMTRPPMGELQARLDRAAVKHPDRASLTDFRAPPELVAAEAEALSHAHQVVTPHAGVATPFGDRAVRLDWKTPPPTPRAPATTRRIAFPGPTAARKGAWEVREAARALNLEVVLTGSELEGLDFWTGVSTQRPSGDWLDGVAAVVQPAIVEERPHRLLAALAAGVPVVASPACGLYPQPGLTLVEPGDTEALIKALRTLIP